MTNFSASPRRWVLALLGAALFVLLARFCIIVDYAPKRLLVKARARRDMATIGKALEQYKSDVGSYPDERVGFAALKSQQGPKWRGPYLPGDIPADPWGRAYIYRFSGQLEAPQLLSYGADGRPGGTDLDEDIVSSK